MLQWQCFVWFGKKQNKPIAVDIKDAFPIHRIRTMDNDQEYRLLNLSVDMN